MKRTIFYKSIIVGVVLFVTTLTLIFAGQLGSWSVINNLNVARAGNVAVLAQDTIIYTFGGWSYTTTPYPVERAIIQPNGSLSNWSIDSQSMISARNSGLGFYHNGYIYAIGGDAGPGMGFSTTVERSQVNLNGTLGKWTTISFPPRGFWVATLIKTSTYIYILGGWDASPDIFRTSINPDGTLGTWVELTSKLVDGRDGLMSILIDSTIFIAGGIGLGGGKRSVEKATINSDGEISSFISISTTQDFHYSGMLVYDGQFLYVVEGYQGGDANYRVERAQVNSDMSLGTWQISTEQRFNYEKSGFGSVRSNQFVYAVGGFNGGDMSSVEYAPILGVTGINRREWEIFE